MNNQKLLDPITFSTSADIDGGRKSTYIDSYRDNPILHFLPFRSKNSRRFLDSTRFHIRETGKAETNRCNTYRPEQKQNKGYFVSGWRASAISIVLYLSISLVLTLHNKMVLQWHRFGFPWLVTGIHNLGSIIGMRILIMFGRFSPTRITPHQRKLILLFSVLYTVNIAISNVSLHHVTIPFHQTVRGTVPVFTIVISAIFFDRRYSTATYLSLVPVIIGVGMATYGDYSFNGIGFALTVLGTVLAAIKTVVTNNILVGDNSLRVLPLDLLYYLAPVALAQTLIWSACSGELARFLKFMHSNDIEGNSNGLFVSLVFNSMIAFSLNVASFTANKLSGALAMTVTGNIKVVLTVIFGSVLFNVDLALFSIIGIFVTILGGGAYSIVRLREPQNRNSTCR